jgi:hypothetical protein
MPRRGGPAQCQQRRPHNESLTFLWTRSLSHHECNIRIIHGNPDDPLLPAEGVDSVLIANSYHEFTNPLAMLDHTFRALR